MTRPFSDYEDRLAVDDTWRDGIEWEPEPVAYVVACRKCGELLDGVEMDGEIVPAKPCPDCDEAA